MSERLFGLATLAVSVALVVVTNAMFVAGVIDEATNTLLFGLILGGGAGTSVGAAVGKRRMNTPDDPTR